jgi:hypothetical protein
MGSTALTRRAAGVELMLGNPDAFIALIEQLAAKIDELGGESFIKAAAPSADAGMQHWGRVMRNAK